MRIVKPERDHLIRFATSSPLLDLNLSPLPGNSRPTWNHCNLASPFLSELGMSAMPFELRIIEDVATLPGKLLQSFAQGLKEMVGAVEEWQKHRGRKREQETCKNLKQDLAIVNKFLTDTVFSPYGGIRDALQKFCDEPIEDNWKIVQDKFDDVHRTAFEAKEVVAGISVEFQGLRPKLMRILYDHIDFKNGMWRYYTSIAMPRDPESIRLIRELITKLDTQNQIIEKAQVKISKCIEELSSYSEN